MPVGPDRKATQIHRFEPNKRMIRLNYPLD
jgi:hypothetical protein